MPTYITLSQVWLDGFCRDTFVIRAYLELRVTNILTGSLVKTECSRLVTVPIPKTAWWHRSGRQMVSWDDLNHKIPYMYNAAVLNSRPFHEVELSLVFHEATLTTLLGGESYSRRLYWSRGEAKYATVQIEWRGV